MQQHLMILVEMLKKVGAGSTREALTSSAIDAFLVFCKREFHRGKDWIAELGLEHVLEEYLHAHGKSLHWRRRPRDNSASPGGLHSSLFIGQERLRTGKRGSRAE